MPDDDADLDPAIRAVARELRTAFGSPSRSSLLARFADALGSEARARASLPRLLETLVGYGAWEPPELDAERVRRTRREGDPGYRAAAVGATTALTLRPARSENMALAGSTLLIAALAFYLLARGELIMPLLWLLSLGFQLAWFVRMRRQRLKTSIQLDDRSVRSSSLELSRQDVRYVTAEVGPSGAKSRVLVAGLADGSAHPLTPEVPAADAHALVAALELELGLLPTDERRAVRARVEVDLEDAGSADAGAAAPEGAREPRKTGGSAS